jgi:hypothetical protein
MNSPYTTDELQGAVPDPNPVIDCSDCGEGYHFADYWEERYVEPDDVNEYEETWQCDGCKELQRRREENQEITTFSTIK